MRVANKKRVGRRGGDAEAEPNQLSSEVSTDDPDITGQLASADWSNVDNRTDDAHLYLNKFSGFLQMLDLLISQRVCVKNSEEIRKLPKLSRCTKHILSTTGGARCLAVLEVQAAGKIFRLLEVDSSDAEKPLSTLLFSGIEEIWLDGEH